jgi:phytol kinase
MLNSLINGDHVGLKALSIVLWLAIVGGLAGAAHYFAPKGSELVRKVVHIGAGHVMLLAWWLKIPAAVCIGFSIFFTIATIVSYYIPVLPSINNIDRKSWGTCFYAMSIGILAAIFWPLNLPQYGALGILVMAWGDGLAGLIGSQFGQRRYTIAGSTKSWEGTATMLLASTIVVLLILGMTQGWSWAVAAIAVVVGLFAAGLEVFAKLGVDNLTVPIGSALLTYGLVQVMAV